MKAEIDDIKLYKGDCMKILPEIADGSVDLVVCDPPYGTIKGLKLDSWNEEDTQWDNTLPTEELFNELLRVVRHNGKVVLFCQEPYTSELVRHGNSYMQFGSKGIWMKDTFANYLSVNKAMVNPYEEFCVFTVKNMVPSDAISEFSELDELIRNQGIDKIAGIMYKEGRYKDYVSAKRNLTKKISKTEIGYGNFFDREMYEFLETQIKMPYTCDEYLAKVEKVKSRTQSVFNLWKGEKYKSSILSYPSDKEKYHPTQKPVALLADLIRTYSNRGDTVMDFTMGSGSTGVACVNTERKFIGIELNEYFNIAEKRIRDAKRNKIASLFEI